jgi:hypothetical protein
MASGFTGSTRLEFGRLIVDGWLEVEANAMLVGRGAVGATRVAPGGIIAPGPGIAMLSVDGDLTLSSGSRYEVGVDPAGGGIAGRLDAVTSTYAFLTPRLGYAADAVTLTLDRNDVRFSDVASSSNQRATSAALEGLAAGSTVQDAV